MYRICEAHYLSGGSPCPVCEITHLEARLAGVPELTRRCLVAEARVEELTSGWWVCPECGPQQYTDADSCCRACGRDCRDPVRKETGDEDE